MLPTDGDYLLYVGDEKIPILASSGASRKSNLKGIRPICPHCGSLWAKLDLSPRNERNEYAVARWPCGECWNPYFTPGSLWKLLCWWDRGADPRLDVAARLFSLGFLQRECLARAAQILGLPLSNLQQREEAPNCQSLDCEHSSAR